MKQLTQADFEHAPEWAKSIAVDKNGTAFYHSIKKEALKNDNDQWWPENHHDYSHYIMGVVTGAKKSGSYADAVKYDASDWQNSAIDREFAE